MQKGHHNGAELIILLEYGSTLAVMRIEPLTFLILE